MCARRFSSAHAHPSNVIWHEFCSVLCFPILCGPNWHLIVLILCFRFIFFFLNLEFGIMLPLMLSNGFECLCVEFSSIFELLRFYSNNEFRC